MTNTCPFCGAPKNESYCKDDLAYLYEEVYECGYDGNRPEERQPKDCMVRQIARLKERLEDSENMRNDLLRQLKGTLNINYELKKEIAALKSELASESAWAKEYKEKP